MDNNPEKKEAEDVPFLLSCRVRLILMGFFGGICLYIMRVNISMAIVCMTPSNEDDDNVTLPWHADCPRQLDDDDDDDETYEFDWSRTMQGQILSAFFWGYLISQVPASYLAKNYGPKHVVFGGMSVLFVATMLSPEAVRISPGLLIALQVIKGLGSGAFYPGLHQLVSQWSPPNERSKMTTFYMSSVNLGNIMGFAISGILCDHGFDGGWASIFYVYGMVSGVWLIIWFLFVYNSPQEHPRITTTELNYIETQMALVDSTKPTEAEPTDIPWGPIMKSKAVWGCIICEFCYSYGSANTMTSLPQYMEDVLRFDIGANGLVSSTPYITMFLITLLAGVTADFMRKKGIHITTVRKFIQSGCFVPPTIFIMIVAFMDCHQAAWAVVFMALSNGFTACTRAGSFSNHIDMAPRFAGVIMGVSNSISSIPGIIAPNITAALTPNGTQEEWRRVWFLYAGIYMVGWISYLVLADATEQPWNRYGLDDDIELKPTSSDQTEKYTPESPKIEKSNMFTEVKEDKAQNNLAYVVDNDDESGFQTEKM